MSTGSELVKVDYHTRDEVLHAETREKIVRVVKE